jgi:hypothetical protein
VAEKVFMNATIAGPVSVYVTDGRITRIRPLQVDKDDLKPWTIEDTKGGTYGSSPGLSTPSVRAASTIPRNRGGRIRWTAAAASTCSPPTA